MSYSEVKHYHGDNGIFLAKDYCHECISKGQSQSFSGVGVQHQNAWAEHAIQTIMYMALTFMVHSSLHWTDGGSEDISLWPFPVKRVVWFHNRVPNCQSGLTPLELLTKSKADHCDLLRSHVWCCPAIVLEPKYATQGKFAIDYWKAMKVKIFTLESNDAWDVVKQEDDMNNSNPPWAF